MQKRIYSGWHNNELLELNDVNQIYMCFELIGIHKEYIDSVQATENFEKMYLNCINNRKYCYRNQGVQVVYSLLQNTYMREDKSCYHISKRSMRHYGITYKGVRVVVHEGIYEVLNTMLELIENDENMNFIYRKYIKRAKAIEFLRFQKNCLDERIGVARFSYQKLFSRIRKQLESRIEGKSNEIL